MTHRLRGAKEKTIEYYVHFCTVNNFDLFCLTLEVLGIKTKPSTTKMNAGSAFNFLKCSFQVSVNGYKCQFY